MPSNLSPITELAVIVLILTSMAVTPLTLCVYAYTQNEPLLKAIPCPFALAMPLQYVLH